MKYLYLRILLNATNADTKRWPIFDFEFWSVRRKYDPPEDVQVYGPQNLPVKQNI